ncbi:MAG TPA: tetratricopeptide repeat-containing sensor histidine kinase [Ignavibacteria bacterium]|nr:tetratricopeptide repeat-containing sensor histidine kinase [Ignavibacteria bacterium]
MSDLEEIKDKLKQRGTSQKDFEEKIDLLNKLAHDVREQQPEKCVSIAEVALDTAKKINYIKGIAVATLNTGLALDILLKLEEAREKYSEARRLFDELGERSLFARATRGIGKTYRKSHKNHEAIEKFEEAAAIFKELGDTRSYALTVSDIADTYQSLHEYARALEYYIITYNVFNEVGDRRQISIIFNRIAVINMLLGEEQEALEYYHKSVDLKRELGDKVNEALSLMNIGLIYYNRKDYDEALKYYNQAQALNIEIGEKRNEAMCNINIAEGLIKKGEFEEAEKRLDVSKEILAPTSEKHFKVSLNLSYSKLYAAKEEFYEAIHFINDALAVAEEVNDKQLILESYESYSNCYAGLSDFEKAHEYFRKYYDLKNEIYTKEMHEKIKNMQYKYEREIALKEAETQKKRGQELEKALTQVESLNEDLKKMNEEKNTFMALVAHDLKNPLNAIMGYAQLARVNPEQFSAEELEDMFNDIEVSARIMSELITNYLEYTTIEAGRVHLEMQEINISNAALYVTDSFKSRSQSKDIKIDLTTSSDSIYVYADKNALTQVLDNLVSNAVKFSPSGTTVTINIEKLEDIVRCTVADQGPGVSKEDQEKLFKKFARLTAKPTAGESSTGLGLSITKRLTEDMNGTIRCESEEGKGAAFILEFPAIS